MVSEKQILEKAGYLTKAGLSVLVASASVLLLSRAALSTDMSGRTYDALNGGMGLAVSMMVYPKKEEE